VSEHKEIFTAAINLSKRIKLMSEKKDISLVLGSGGARGLAHIGVIHFLEENNYQIRSISGCSMGALIGGIYAAGKLDEFEKWIREVTKLDILALLDLSWEKSGLVKGDKIINTLINLVGEISIEKLSIPFTAVATDLKNEKEVWITSGRLFDAIRASISMPLFFTPFCHKGTTLIDGGVLNPVPIAPTFSDETDMTIAVNLGGPADISEEVSAGSFDDNVKPTQRRKIIGQFIASIQNTVTHRVKKNQGVFEIALQAFDAMQSTIARQKLAAYPPDMVIEISRSACGTLDFHKASEMIDLGYKRARSCLM
jgi:NTE family protein